MGLKGALVALQGSQIHSYVKFSEDPHYVLKEVKPGIHRWVVGWVERQDNKLVPLAYNRYILNKLNTVTPDSLSDPQPLSSGSSGVTWMARHPELGEIVFKWGGLASALPKGNTPLVENVSLVMNLLYNTTPAKWASAVSQVIGFLGGAALPSGHNLWSAKDLKRHLPPVWEEFQRLAKLAAKKYGEKPPGRLDTTLFPVALSPRLHLHSAEHPPVDLLNIEGAGRLIGLESLLGAPDRHWGNRLWALGEDGKAHLVGIDYGWVGTGHVNSAVPFGPHDLYKVPEDHIKEEIKETMSHLDRSYRASKRYREGILDAIRRIDAYLPEISFYDLEIPRALQDNLEVFYNAFKDVKHPLKDEALR